MTKSQVASRIGVSAARYSNWEKVFGSLPIRQYGDALNRLFTTGGALSETAQAGPIEQTGQIPLSISARAVLGQRAAERREALGLKPGTVSRSVGIAHATLISWEERLPERPRDLYEALWEDALGVDRGWLRDPSRGISGDQTELAHRLDLTAANLASVSDEIRMVGVWLSRKLGHLRTCDYSQLTSREKMRADSFALRFGVNGTDQSTLQGIGTVMALTRERIRQVLDRMMERANGVGFILPRLMQLRRVVTESGLESVEAFERSHRQLLGERLTLTMCDAFARQLVGVSVATVTPWARRQTGNALQPMVSPYAVDVALVVRDCSRRMIRSSGAAHVFFVTGMVSDALQKDVSVTTVLSSLQAIDGMQWLSDDNDWYWFGPETSGNRALDTARRALAVAGRRLDIEELHQGLCRARRHRYDEDLTSPPAIEVPQRVLLEVYSRVPWLKVLQHNDLVLAEPILESVALSESELSVVQVIRANGGAVSRKMLSDALCQSGVNSAPTIQLALANSPVVRALGFGIFGLRGVPFSEAALARARASLGTSITRQIDTDANGCIQFELTISTYNCNVGIMDFPARVVSAIAMGEYSLDGIAHGTVKIGSVKSAATRVSGFMSRLRNAGRAYPQTMDVCISSEKRTIILTDVASS